MAVNRRRRTTGYSTYGSVAYAPTYDGNAARVPRREEELRRAPAPQPKKPVRRHERAQVEVRQAGAVAPFAVVGFLAVAVFAALLVTSYAQLTVANDELVSLRRQLTSLEAENTVLSAQYERVFDLATIQAAVGDTMVRPTSEQVVYIDLSAPDTVTVFQGEGASGLKSILQGVGDILDGIIEYFR
jgi:cell division protein FtsB